MTNIPPIPEPPPRTQWGFIEELAAPVHRKLRMGILLRLQPEFPDPEGLLRTAYRDFERMIEENNARGSFPVITRKCRTGTFEAYRVRLTRRQCVVSAADAEGIRRGLFEVEDLLQSRGEPVPFSATRRPWLKNRIGRGFFSPVKRHPVYADELLDSVNYYPDEYLNRLAHEGVNGLWIVAALRELGVCEFEPPDPERETRLKKLRSTIDRAAAYGIKIWLLCIEPFAVFADDPLLRNHPELFGAVYGGRHCFCPSSPATGVLLRQLTSSLFSAVPELGGIINITHGERPTTCLSAVSALNPAPVPCPRCGKLAHGEIIRRSLTAMRDGIASAVPGERLIAWFYFPHTARLAPWTRDIAAAVPDGVTAQFNFESGGIRRQQGKIRHGGDYWVSYPGPSPRFRRQAAALRKGASLSAKIQTGCGYEFGLVPFVPVPGLLYGKFRAMKALGVDSAMLCWYIGGYPGIMNRGAGMLAFDDFSGKEKDFLVRLLAPQWGTCAAAAAAAYRKLGKAYHKFPFSLMFQYYGPQNLGAGMPWSLYPLLRPLPPPWKPTFAPVGDAIGEALAGISLEDAGEAFRAITDEWRTGCAALGKLGERHPENQCEVDLVRVIGLLFESARNTLDFYALRRAIFLRNDRTAAAAMRNLAELEIALTQKLYDFFVADSRLGFHSEAFCHRLYPELFRWRLGELMRLRDETLPEFIAAAGTPWEIFMRRSDAPRVYTNGAKQTCGSRVWAAELTGDFFEFRMEKPLPPSFTLYFCDCTGSEYPLVIHLDTSTGELSDNQACVSAKIPPARTNTRVTEDGRCIRAVIPRRFLPGGAGKLRFNLLADGTAAFGECSSARLHLPYSPEQTAVVGI